MSNNLEHKFQLTNFVKNTAIIYRDENDFIKKLRGLKRINKRAYKQFVFEICKNERYWNRTNGTHEIELDTDSLFRLIHGKVLVHYTTIKNGKCFIIDNLSPEDLLINSYFKDPVVIKGVPIKDDKDIVKLNIVLKMEDK